jgi:hypothetical protein
MPPDLQMGRERLLFSGGTGAPNQACAGMDISHCWFIRVIRAIRG